MNINYKPVHTNRFGNGKKYHSHDGFQSHLINSEHGIKKGVFLKGQIPWNKGTKGIMKANKGSFTSQRMSMDKHPMWRGGHQYYRGLNWKKLAKSIIKKEGNVCQDCTRTENLQVHHLIPYRLFDSYQLANRVENLISLCPSCHKKAEWELQKHGLTELGNILYAI